MTIPFWRFRNNQQRLDYFGLAPGATLLRGSSPYCEPRSGELRGVLLLMMSVDHSPSSLRRFTDQPLGFFSTAECFVFVSAFLADLSLLAGSATREAAPGLDRGQKVCPTGAEILI
jgi:hypothetical protein